MLHLDHLILTQGDFTLTADWQADPGARIAVIGPSGAGKSTLLSAIAGFLDPAGGRIMWQGSDLAGVAPGRRPVSVLFQDQNLFPHLTIADNIGLGLSPALRLTAADRARIDAVLDRLGLGGLGGRRPGDLSGGQQSRAALARVLLRARPVLLLDEPFAALGPAMKSDLLDLTVEVAAETGALVMLVTHDPRDARRFAPLTCFVADGVAHVPQPTAALLDAPPPALGAYLGESAPAPAPQGGAV